MSEYETDLALPLTGSPSPEAGADNPYPVYHRVMLLRSGQLGVVCLQDFDECDYDRSRFVHDDESGEPYYWISEQDAREWLAASFQRDAIDPEDRLEEQAEEPDEPGPLTLSALAHLRR